MLLLEIYKNKRQIINRKKISTPNNLKNKNLKTQGFNLENNSWNMYQIMKLLKNIHKIN